ncbi:MAG: hypothetical protein IPN33_25350 [Saprospiraceae bacterium]|nr:hypothetical protein [Saprospiraceae bacterium]
MMAIESTPTAIPTNSAAHTTRYLYTMAAAIIPMAAPGADANVTRYMSE